MEENKIIIEIKNLDNLVDALLEIAKEIRRIKY